MNDDVYTINEVATRLKVSRSTVYRAIRQRTIRAIHVGTQQRITHAEYERVLREGTVVDIESVARFRHTAPIGKTSRR